MAQNPEALAQIARLLGDDSLRNATAEEVRRVASLRLERLVEGLVAEAASSDDVTDRESALFFLEARIGQFRGLLPDDAPFGSRLWQAIRAKIDPW